MAERNLQSEMEEWQKKRDLNAEMAEWQSQSEQKAEPSEDRPWYAGIQDFSEGIGQSALETYYGAKDLVTDLDDEDRANLQAWRDAAGESGWGQAGRIAGEMAQMAVPGTVGLKVAAKVPRALKHAQGLRSATRAGADIGGAALHGATALPEEGKTRAERATESALAGLGGAALGKALRIGGMGIRGTEEAQRLRKAGAELTPGRTNDILARVEGVLNLWPVTAKGVQRARTASNRSLRQAANTMADPLERRFNRNPLLKAASQREINKKIGGAFDEGYDAVWKGVDLPKSSLDQIETIALRGADRLGKNKQNAVFRLVDDLRGKTAGEADALIREAVRTGKPHKIRDINNVLYDMRRTLRGSLPKENKKLLGELDKRYGKYSAVKNATTRSSAEKQSGDFDMADLLGGQSQASLKNVRAVGEGPYTQYLDDAFRAIGDEHQPLLTASRAMIQRIPSLGTASLGRIIAGGAPGQRFIRENVEEYYPDILRNLYSGARLGAAIED